MQNVSREVSCLANATMINTYQRDLAISNALGWSPTAFEVGGKPVTFSEKYQTGRSLELTVPHCPLPQITRHGVI